MLARFVWVGREVQCPHCRATLRIPAPSPDGQPALAAAPALAPKRVFNFACPRCDCLLESHTGMSGSEGRCPTCGSRFLIPYIQRGSGMPTRVEVLEGDVQDPTPVHAYAASGDQAPQIVRDDAGTPHIRCPRCHAESAIEADACVGCGAPFSIEGASTLQTMRWNRPAITAMVAGVIALPLAMLFLPGVLAIALGMRAISLYPGMKPSFPAVVAIVFGIMSIPLGFLLWAL
jgi:DNA-directed RNA polymerase subunit RPC12/RpoP